MNIKSDEYTGDGVDGREVTGVGFQADFVLIKSDQGAHAVMSTSTMMPDQAKVSPENALALVADAVQSFTADGFTVGADLRTNEDTTLYRYLALKAQAADSKVGSYTGDGGASQAITGVGFQPTFVLILPAGTVEPCYLTAELDAAGNTASCFTHAHHTGYINTLDADGFTVGSTMNAAGTFYYLALKDVAGIFDTFTYTGNGTDNRSIAISTGFTPQFVLVHVNNNPGAAVRLKTHTGDNSQSVSGPVGADQIQAFETNGMQVGTTSTVNTNTNRYDGWWMREAAASGGGKPPGGRGRGRGRGGGNGGGNGGGGGLGGGGGSNKRDGGALRKSRWRI